MCDVRFSKKKNETYSTAQTQNTSGAKLTTVY
jgi:hypothetical protein